MLRIVLGILVVAIGVTLVFLINTWLDAQPQRRDTALVDDDGTHTIEKEGRDEAAVTTDKKEAYTVEASAPRMLTIKKLNLHARVLPMSVNTNNTIQAPINVYDAGWYIQSARPGADGATFIDGHASGPTRQGLFAYLDTLVTGDTVEIEKGDGTLLTYRVVHVETTPLDSTDMNKVLAPYGDVKQGLNLMTCTGKWLEAQKTYDQRVVVYTELV